MCVQLTGQLEIPITAAISFEENTATSQDHSNTNRNLTFDSGSSNPQCFLLVIVDDGLLESEEVFGITLSSPDSEVDIVNGSALVTILDSSELTVGFTSATGTVTEGEVFLACVDITAGQLAELFSLVLLVEASTGQGIHG